MQYIAAVRLTLVFLLCLCPLLAEAGQQGRSITGVVLDASGAPVPDATVTVNGTTARTANDGTFEVTAPPGRVVLEAVAPGFSTTSLPVTDSPRGVRLVLQPAPIEDNVLVTASGGDERLGTAGSMTMVSSAELLTAAAGSLDDALRSTPGFSLFRRSSSRTANPTTQGVTLRGVSGSGASRTLVLADGVPLNDPFGSWVYWNRVPLAAVERVEIVRGSTGDLYGADALGGVVQVLTFAPGTPRIRFTADGGSHDTGRVSGFANVQRNGWFGEGSAEWLRTDGAFIVAESDRGLIDIRADSDYETGFFGGGYNAGPWHAAVRVSLYDEARGNGTPVQVNSTNWKQVSADAGGAAGVGSWLVRGSGGTQDYYQTFTAPVTVAGVPRSAERLTSEQTIPSRFGAFSGQWTGALGPVVAMFGGEGRRTRSTAEEITYSFTGVPSAPNLLGGVETSGAAFARVSLVPVEPLTIVLGGRGDYWRTEPRNPDDPTHTASLFSPRVSAGYRLTEGVSLHGAAYRSHRTPSLNELYRGFRIGTLVTNPNPELDPETLTGVEGGLLYSRGGVSARVTGFTNKLENAITNVTIIPNLLRQRQNTDTVRATGVEFEIDLRPHPRWAVGALAVATRSRFVETPEQPDIEGNTVPQVPGFQLGGNVSYVDPIGLTVSLQARAFGSQWDDDTNEVELGEYGVVDFSASQQVVRGFTVFAAVENLFDKEYDVGRGGQRTIGWPRTARFGIRVFLP
jgi:outer membrane receptor protein involved in Fe transport